MRISENVLRQPRSGIRRILEIAQAMENVIHLEIGEPQFETPRHIVAAACEALNGGDTKYTPNAGTDELRTAVAARVSQRTGRSISKDHVLVGVGGVEVINATIRTICDAGDNILVPDPAWPNYQTMCTIANIEPRFYALKAENGFYPDLEQMKALVDDRTRIMIVNSPSNPLGVMFDAEMMESLCKFAEEHNLYLLSDEAYEDITYDKTHVSPLKFDPEGKRVIGAYTMSKSYAMTGWRIGYVIAAPEMIDQMKKLQEAYVSSVAGALQHAAAAAIVSDQACVKSMRDEYAVHRQKAMEILDQAGMEYLAPNGAFYLWINVHTEDSTMFAEQFLKEKHVAVAPGSAFGVWGKSYLRVSLASSAEEIEEGMRRLVAFCGK